MFMKKKLSFLSLLCLLAALPSCNNSGSNKDAVEKADSANEKKLDSSSGTPSTTVANTIDQETADFMVKAADGGMEEVQMGKVANEKAVSQRVKNFGAMMVEDHSKANDELKGLAAQKNVTLPKEMADEHKKDIENVQKKTGKNFDKEYIEMMVDDHQKDIDEFEKASKNTKDTDVKMWVDKTLPVLRKHLDSAKAINNSLK